MRRRERYLLALGKNAGKKDSCSYENKDARQESFHAGKVLRRSIEQRETHGQRFGLFRGTGFSGTDLRCPATRGAEPCDLGLDSKQRRQQAKNDAQCCQTRMPDHRSSLHVQ